MLDIKPRISFEPKTCINNLRSPQGWYRATRKARPFQSSESERFPEAGSAHNAGCQLRSIGKVIREVIQEVVDKSRYSVQDSLTFVRS